MTTMCLIGVVVSPKLSAAATDLKAIAKTTMAENNKTEVNGVLLKLIFF